MIRANAAAQEELLNEKENVRKLQEKTKKLEEDSALPPAKPILENTNKETQTPDQIPLSALQKQKSSRSLELYGTVRNQISGIYILNLNL